MRWKTSSTDKWLCDLAGFARGGGKRRVVLTEDFFTINVQIKKKKIENQTKNQEHQLLWKANASETNQTVQSCAVVHRVTASAACTEQPHLREVLPPR